MCLHQPVRVSLHWNKYVTDTALRGATERWTKVDPKEWETLIIHVSAASRWPFLVSTYSSVQPRWVCWCAVYQATPLRNANSWEDTKGGVNKSMVRGGEALCDVITGFIFHSSRKDMQENTKWYQCQNLKVQSQYHPYLCWFWLFFFSFT